MARRATAIAQYRRSAPGEVLVVDGGDSLYDAGDWPQEEESGAGALQVAAMNAMGYDALALGMADVAPLAITQARIQEAHFAFLSANLGPSAILTGVQPYLLREIEGRMVAIIGVSHPERLQARLDGLSLPLTVGDSLAAVRRIAADVHERTDVIIVLSNLEEATNVVLAQEVPGIDAIIGVAKSWRTEPSAIQGIEGPVVLQGSATLGEYIGLLTLYFDAQGRVVSFTGRGVPLGPDFGADREMQRMIEAYAPEDQ